MYIFASTSPPPHLLFLFHNCVAPCGFFAVCSEFIFKYFQSKKCTFFNLLIELCEVALAQACVKTCNIFTPRYILVLFC